MPSRMVCALLLATAFVEASTPVAAQKAEPQPTTGRRVWSIIKRQLMAADGEDYFENSLKGAMVPGGVEGLTVFTGILLSAEPATKPSVLVVAISDSTTPEVTLQMKDAEWKDTHLNGQLMRGSLIQFEGIPTAFTNKPFMLTFGVSITKRSQVLKVTERGR